MKSVYNRILATVATLLALTSCDWLDVAPAKQATFDDAMKDKAHVEAWIYSCYKTVGTSAPGYAFNIEGSTDEFTTPKVWWANTVFRHPMAYATISSSSNQAQWWRELYGTIGHVHLFLRELDRQNPSFLTEDDKALYRAHAAFIKAFNYFKILFYFGPCPIIDEYVGSDTAISSFPGRSHFDYCVDYICGLLDEAAARPQMPSGYELNATYGRANKTIIAALKARLLLYAASDLWNGKFPYLNWRNENFETPGYGKELVSYTFDIEKWKRAKTACEDAIRIATANGRRLLELEDAKLLAQRKIGSVGISHQSGTVQLETAIFIHIGFVYRHAQYFCQEHMMRSKLLYFRHAAFDIDRTLLDGGRVLKTLRPARRQMHFRELVHIPARTHAAVIGSLHKLFRGQVDDELAGFPDNIIGIPVRSYGDGYHSGVGTNRPGPRHRDNIWFFTFPSTAYHNCRKGIEHIACSPVLLFLFHIL